MAAPDIFGENEVKQEFTKRLFGCFLDIIVIAHYKQEPFSGYDVVQFAMKRFGILLSPGTVYATLYSMERQEILSGIVVHNKRMFKATEKGLQLAQLAMSPKELNAFFANITET